MHVSLIRAVTISVELKENESTTKGSDRILKSKRLPNIVDPQYATRHTAEELGAIVALYILGHLTQRETSVVLILYSKYSQVGVST